MRYATILLLLLPFSSLTLIGCTLPGPTLHVATLNLAHGRGLKPMQVWLDRDQAEANIDAVAEAVGREAPEVLAVQEADGPSSWSGDFDHVARLAESVPFPFVHHGLHLNAALLGRQVRYGTAILSRHRLDSPQSYPFAANWYHAKGFVTAEIEFDGGPVLLASIHLDSGSAEVRRKQVEQITRTLREHIDEGEQSRDRTDPGGSMILMGDFNSRWDQEDDALRMLVSGLRLHAYKPESIGLLTYRSNRPRARIDWMLISRDLEFIDYRTWPDQVSDHLALSAEVRRRKR